ncbi:type II toxin-antitoxin system RelE/ParE family toxin [Sodalis ligni]|uniref:type II toxin-antitoxin system RelE family toxin n=1 Tax=Sodalis ligni TaxID=2697027 RepID=UPI001BDEA957|nr:type II toxin-antitoxin system RelE/ParE family toxin [Sodalis ligni]QWA09835.1 type II toxin-antitoxin system RelE/ParE family toxin [Sodalis ligni]
MSYELEFEEHALKEFKNWARRYGSSSKEVKEILVNPHIPANRLSGMPDCYKIKLRSAGYRLVYQAIDEEVIVLVLAVGKRERSEVYNAAKARL